MSLNLVCLDLGHCCNMNDINLFPVIIIGTKLLETICPNCNLKPCQRKFENGWHRHLPNKNLPQEDEVRTKDPRFVPLPTPFVREFSSRKSIGECPALNLWSCHLKYNMLLKWVQCCKSRQAFKKLWENSIWANFQSCTNVILRSKKCTFWEDVLI